MLPQTSCRFAWNEGALGEWSTDYPDSALTLYIAAITLNIGCRCSHPLLWSTARCGPSLWPFCYQKIRSDSQLELPWRLVWRNRSLDPGNGFWFHPRNRRICIFITRTNSVRRMGNVSLKICQENNCHIGHKWSYSNFKKHAENVHSKKWCEYEKIEVKSSAEGVSLDRFTTTKMTPARRHHLNLKPAQTIIEESLSFSLIQNPSFRDWVHVTLELKSNHFTLYMLS